MPPPPRPVSRSGQPKSGAAGPEQAYDGAQRTPPTPAEVDTPLATPGPAAATLFLMVGLPGAGKTTRAHELAATHGALALTPDRWMIPLYGDNMAGGKRFVLEGRLISLALEALRLGTSVVLDFGLWAKDERSALRWLARASGATSRVVYLPVEKDVQRARIAHRQQTAPHQTYPMSEADLDGWRMQFQAPGSEELAEGDLPDPPSGWTSWPEWAEHHWPSCTDR